MGLTMKLNLKRFLSQAAACAMGYGLVLVAAMVFAPPAHGQSAPRPACYPLINGYPVGMPQQRTGTYGVHVFWFCSDSKGGPLRAEGISCLKNLCSEALAGQAMAAVTRASAKVGTANAEWDKHVAFNCPDVEAEQTPRGNLCRERKAFLEANRAAWGLPAR